MHALNLDHDHNAADEPQGKPALGGLLAALALCTLLPALGTSIANVALPTLAEIFHSTFPQVQWVVLGYLLVTTALVVGAGRLGDLIGRRRLLLRGIVLFTLASGLCGLAPGLEWLIAARALQGVGAAILMALTMAFVGAAVPKERSGSAMGLLGSMSAVGTALGPTLGGALIAGFGWPAIFFVKLPLGLLALLLVRRYLPADRLAAAQAQAQRPGFDAIGTLLMALTLAGYALAMTTGRGGGFGQAQATLLLAAALGAGLFVWTEARVASPLISLARLRDARLGASLAVSALVSTVVMATLIVGPFYLARALGLATTAVGIVMSIGPAVAALSGVPAGRMVDRIGAPRTVLGGLMGMVLGCLALAASGIVPATLGIAGYAVPIAVVTAGYALFQAANNQAVMADVAPDQRGVISGLLNLSRNLGLVTGASAMGLVFVSATRAPDLARAGPEAVAMGMRVSFGVAAALLTVALLIVWRGHRSTTNDRTAAQAGGMKA